MKKKGFIVGEGFYPIGSMSIRMRMWAKGFQFNNVKIKLLIVSPPPTKFAIENSDSFVKFLLNPIGKNINIASPLYLYYRILGAIKLFILLLREKNIDFIIITRPNIVVGFVILFFRWFKKYKFFFDKGDESGILVDKKIEGLIDFLSNLNHRIFGYFILPKVDKLFVVSSYLENKYKNKFPNLYIKKSAPTLIDYEEFCKNKKYDIFKIGNGGFTVFKSKKIKIFYGGSCERTNGIFFFLNIASNIIHEGKFSFEIIFIFIDGDIEKVKSFCEKVNISERVTFLKPILPKYMPALYANADILILPEHGDIIANAGFPGKTGEYLASGKAILATIFSDLQNFLIHNKNAMLASIGDSETYTKNFVQLLENTELREKLGKNAIQTAIDSFDYKEVVKIYLYE